MAVQMVLQHPPEGLLDLLPVPGKASEPVVVVAAADEDEEQSSSSGFSLGASTSSSSPSSPSYTPSSSSASSVAASPVLDPSPHRSDKGDIDRSETFFLDDGKHARRSRYASHLVQRQAKALLDLAARLDQQPHDVDSTGQDTPDSFAQALEILETMDKHGKVVLIGVGKSGLLARKAVATFNSLGIQSTFLHPVEALHGDLGTISPYGIDVAILISYSGKTNELLQLTSLLRQRRCRALISITKPDSPLARSSDVCIDGSLEADLEADPELPAPTSSVLVALAILDSLALSLLRVRTGWHDDGQARRETFAECHPGGNLAKVLKNMSLEESGQPAEK